MQRKKGVGMDPKVESKPQTFQTVQFYLFGPLLYFDLGLQTQNLFEPPLNLGQPSNGNRHALKKWQMA